LGYSVSGDSHNYGNVGSALATLSGVAERTGTAILGLTHPPKGSSDPVTAAIGSTAWTAIPRIVLVLGLDPEDETGERRAVRVSKTNFREPDSGLSFEIADDETHECGFVNCVAPSTASAESLVARSEGSEVRSERAAIAELIAQWCADGPVFVDEVARRVRDAGYEVSAKTVQRAAKRAGANAVPPVSAGGKWSYRLVGSVDTVGTDKPS
jgi:hypothetical protein